MPDVQLRPAPITSRPADRLDDLGCSSTETGDASLVHLAGELDVATIPQLQRTLRASRGRSGLVVLDMRELRFIDSSGVHAITDAGIRAGQTGRRLVLVRGPAAVDRVFTLVGRSEHVEVADLAPGEPAIQVLLQLAHAERA